jgi:cell division protein FtsQ
MVRTQGPSTDDPFYRRGQADRPTFVDDALPLDAGLTDADDEDQQQQFRRAKRVPVRRGAIGRKAASRVRVALLWTFTIAIAGGALYGIHLFAARSGRFRLRSASDIEVAGEAPNSRATVMERMREAVGRNIFAVSLSERKHEVEKIPWVESATVMRLWPNHLRVVVKERTPVAFVDIAGRVQLIDAQGVVMEMSPSAPGDYSFPVILGMAETDPLSTRAARMKIFLRLTRELDGDGTRGKVQYSRNLEEVDLSDPGDVKVTVKGPSGPIVLHLGDENFLPRFMVYLSNVQKWEQERGKLQSVDLRYGREVILNPDLTAVPRAAASPAVPAQPVAAPAVKHKAVLRAMEVRGKQTHLRAVHAGDKHPRRRAKRN